MSGAPSGANAAGVLSSPVVVDIAKERTLGAHLLLQIRSLKRQRHRLPFKAVRCHQCFLIANVPKAAATLYEEGLNRDVGPL